MLGFEIEAIYKADYYVLSRGDYHSDIPPFLPYSNRSWMVERDGSLGWDNYDMFKMGWKEPQACEFISIPTPLNEAKSTLKAFQKAISVLTKSDKLSNSLLFNNTTGAHLNFSFWKKAPTIKTIIERGELKWAKEGIQISNKVYPPQAYAQLRKTLKKELTKMMGKDKTKEWFKHYNRRMAKIDHIERLTSETIFHKDKHREFNMDLHSPRIEWRGIHLRGITEWEDFFKLYDCVFKTLKEVLFQLDKKKGLMGVLSNEIAYNLEPLQKNKCINEVCIFRPIITKEIKAEIEINQRTKKKQIINITESIMRGIKQNV